MINYLLMLLLTPCNSYCNTSCSGAPQVSESGRSVGWWQDGRVIISHPVQREHREKKNAVQAHALRETGICAHALYTSPHATTDLMLISVFCCSLEPLCVKTCFCFWWGRGGVAEPVHCRRVISAVTRCNNAVKLTFFKYWFWWKLWPFLNHIYMLHASQVDQLREAIEELYYFEFVLDDIPIWGFVGYIEESGFLPHSHKVNFCALYFRMYHRVFTTFTFMIYTACPKNCHKLQ